MKLLVGVLLVVLMVWGGWSMGNRGNEVAAASPRVAGLQNFQSRHYTILSDLPAELVRPMAAHMDMVFDEYVSRFSSFRPRNNKRMPLYLIDRREDFIEFMRRHGIDAVNSGGLFAYGGRIEGLFIWTRGRTRADVLRTLQHEGFHQFAYAYIGPNLPIWANEGIAVYFENALPVGNRLFAGLVEPNMLHTITTALDNRTTIPFENMLKLSSEEWGRFVSTNVPIARILYAQAWSMVHFLVHGENGRYREAFERYLSLLAAGRTVDQAFQTAFGTSDHRAFELRWREYVAGLKPDPIFTAMQRMEFLALGLQGFHANQTKMPADIDALRQQFQQRGLHFTQTINGVQTRYHARDDRLFSFENAAGQTRPFSLLAPAREGLPPRVLAPGLRPEPMLIWDINPVTKQLEYGFVFRGS